eukprot:647109-Hanusia_phi.AAC.1
MRKRRGVVKEEGEERARTDGERNCEEGIGEGDLCSEASPRRLHLSLPLLQRSLPSLLSALQVENFFPQAFCPRRGP